MTTQSQSDEIGHTIGETRRDADAKEYRAKQIRRTATRQRSWLKTRKAEPGVFVSMGGPWEMGRTRKVLKGE